VSIDILTAVDLSLISVGMAGKTHNDKHIMFDLFKGATF
jgi:hypothetical protein